MLKALCTNFIVRPCTYPVSSLTGVFLCTWYDYIMEDIKLFFHDPYCGTPNMIFCWNQCSSVCSISYLFWLSALHVHSTSLMIMMSVIEKNLEILWNIFWRWKVLCSFGAVLSWQGLYLKKTLFYNHKLLWNIQKRKI